MRLTNLETDDPGYLTWDDASSDDDPAVGWSDLGDYGWTDSSPAPDPAPDTAE